MASTMVFPPDRKQKLLAALDESKEDLDVCIAIMSSLSSPDTSLGYRVKKREYTVTLTLSNVPSIGHSRAERLSTCALAISKIVYNWPNNTVSVRFFRQACPKDKRTIAALFQRLPDSQRSSWQGSIDWAASNVASRDDQRTISAIAEEVYSARRAMPNVLLSLQEIGDRMNDGKSVRAETNKRLRSKEATDGLADAEDDDDVTTSESCGATFVGWSMIFTGLPALEHGFFEYLRERFAGSIGEIFIHLTPPHDSLVINVKKFDADSDIADDALRRTAVPSELRKRAR